MEGLTEDPLEKFKRLMIENNQKLLDEYQEGFMKLLDDFGKQFMPSLDFLADLTSAQTNIEAFQQQILNDQVKIEELTQKLAEANQKLEEIQEKHENALSVVQKQEIQLEDLRKIRDLFEDIAPEIKTTSNIVRLDGDAPKSVGHMEENMAKVQMKMDLINKILQECEDVPKEKVRSVIGQFAVNLRQEKDTLASVMGNLPTTCPGMPASVPAMPNTLRINAEIGQITGEICENNRKIENLTSQTEISSILARNLKLIEKILALNPEMVFAAVKENHVMEQEEKLVKKKKKPTSTNTTIPKCANPSFTDLIHSKPKKAPPAEPKALQTQPKAPQAQPEAPPAGPQALPPMEYLLKTKELKKELKKLVQEKEGLLDTIESLSADSDPEFLDLAQDNRAHLEHKIEEVSRELRELEEAQNGPKKALDEPKKALTPVEPKQALAEPKQALAEPKPATEHKWTSGSAPESSSLKKELHGMQRSMVMVQQQLRSSQAENLELKSKIARLEAESGLKIKESGKNPLEAILGDLTLVDDDDERYEPFDNLLAAQRELVHKVAKYTADTQAREKAKKEAEPEGSPLSKPASVDSDGWNELVVGAKEEI